MSFLLIDKNNNNNNKIHTALLQSILLSCSSPGLLTWYNYLRCFPWFCCFPSLANCVVKFNRMSEGIGPWCTALIQGACRQPRWPSQTTCLPGSRRNPDRLRCVHPRRSIRACVRLPPAAAAAAAKIKRRACRFCRSACRPRGCARIITENMDATLVLRK